MSSIVGNHLKLLNIECLKIISPVLDYFDDSKFKALYEAISVSNVKRLELTPIMVRTSSGPFQYAFSDLPISGIEILSNSGIQTLVLEYRGSTNASRLPSILKVLPNTIKDFTVSLLSDFSSHLCS